MAYRTRKKTARPKRRSTSPSNQKAPRGSLRRNGSFDWRYGEHYVVSLNWRIDFPAGEPDAALLELSYLEPVGWVRQRLRLVRLPSSLGRSGGVWYFVCSQSGVRCRTLYHQPGGFVSRAGIDGPPYPSQRPSQSYCQNVLRLVGRQQLVDLTLGWVLRPGSKRNYGGRLSGPMRRWLKLEQQVRQTTISALLPTLSS